MKKVFMIVMMGLLVSSSYAQEVVSGEGSAQASTVNNIQHSTFTFGYLSYEAALKSMPQYAIVQQQMAELCAQYQAEMKRVEDEFNRKYEDFLEGQREFPKTILQKRQTELQELLEKNIAFKEESRQQLVKAEQEAMAPLKIRLIELLQQIGTERGYAFVYDTDTKALPFILPEAGVDINQTVQNALQ